MSRAVNLLRLVMVYGVPLSLSLSALITMMLVRNPRLLLRSYPEDVRNAVPPLSVAEKRERACWAAMFLALAFAFPFAAALAAKTAHRDFLDIFLSGFGVAFLFNLVDWLILDWLIVCTVTPKFVVLPGTAGMAGYKNYRMHFRGFLLGSVVSLAIGLLMATAATFLRG
jgi:hypothetical protein